MLKFPALYGPVLISEIQSAKKVLICGGSPKKVTVCIPPSPLPDYHALYKFCWELDENCGNSSLLKILTSDILQSASNDPNWTQMTFLYKHLFINL